MNKKTLLISIPVAVLLANLLGYAIVTQVRSSRSSRSSSSQVAPGEIGGSVAPVAGGSAAPTSEDRAKEEIALARRAAGVAALEAGDYEHALIAFTEARALLGDKAYVGELLRVTEDLRKHPRVEPLAREDRPAPAAAPARAAARPVSRRIAVREPTAAEATPAPAAAAAAPATGLLIVTTVPRGLLVQIDDAPVDLTPMRTAVKRGSHRVVLVDGTRKVYETTVEVREGGATTVVKDLSTEIAAEPARAVAASAAPARVPQEESAAPSLAAPVLDVPPLDPSATAPRPAGTGALAISSPGLYGVVWINGRPRGYPPLEARDLPAGPTKVEVRVNGVEKRASTVVVQPGLTTPVKLLSLETAP